MALNHMPLASAQTVAPSNGVPSQPFTNTTANPFPSSNNGPTTSPNTAPNPSAGGYNGASSGATGTNGASSGSSSATQMTLPTTDPNATGTPASTTDGSVPSSTPTTTPSATEPLSVPNTAPAAGGSVSNPNPAAIATPLAPVTMPTHQTDAPPPVVKSLPLVAPEVVPLRSSLEKKQTLVLSLQDACRLAEGKSISIHIAKENVKIQQSDYYLRLSDLLPDITGSQLDSRLVGGVQVFGGQTTQVTRTTYQPQVTMNYSVYTGGRNIFDIQASKHRLNALKNQTEATRQDILRQIALAYYDMQAAYWQRNLAQQSLKEAEQQMAVNYARYKSGVGLQVDALQAEGNRSLQRQNLVQADIAVSQASENLAQLLNLDFEVEILPDSLDAMMIERIPESLKVPELLTIAKKNNPNLDRLAELARAGKSDRNTAVADLFPQVNLTAYRNRTGANASEALPTSFTGLQATWNVLENLGAARPLNIRQANASMEVAKSNVAQGQRLLQQSIVNTHISILGLKETIQASWDNLRASQAAYAQASGRLQAGVGTNLELQLAQVNLATARSNLATAFFNYNRLQVAQLANLGVLNPDTIAHGYKIATNTSTPPASLPATKQP